MESLAIMSAAPVLISLAGRTYRLTPLTLSDYGEIEAAIRQDHTRDQAEIPADEMAQWVSQGDGLALVIWLMLRAWHPVLSLEECQALVAAERDQAALARQLDRANGLPVGNGCGRA